MTMQHYSILAGYALWTYILLCMFGKVLADLYHRSWMLRQRRWICAFFSPWLAQGGRRGRLKRLLRLSRDNLLLNQICSSYCAGKSRYDPQSAQALEHTMRLVFHWRLRKASEESAMTRSLLAKCIVRSNVHSDLIDGFLSTCRSGSRLEQLWAQEAEEDCPVLPGEECAQ